jgi:predicted CXXCH cytochrome family protein
MDKRSMIIWVAVVVGLLSGCDPLTTHKITSTIFDGVPSMPSAEQYCREYHLTALAKEREAEKVQLLTKKTAEASVHPPFAEKRCNDCHDKNTDSGFVAPVKDLCSVCHKDFLQGKFAHGPAAVGACLSCHLPHDSQYSSLLKKPKDQICLVCHKEPRLAQGLHSAAKAREMVCTDCHNPHAGNNSFFME